MNKYLKDPLLLVSILLAAAGAIQANTSMLSELAAKHPTAFGLVMTAVSVVTGVLTAFKTFLLNRPPDIGNNSGV
jgi:hypothetical protein